MTNTLPYSTVGGQLQWHTREDQDDLPKEEGWYRVRVSGDSESIDGFTIYNYPDYDTWAYFTPANPEEFESFKGGWKGSFTGVHDEENSVIYAFYGPIKVPNYE